MLKHRLQYNVKYQNPRITLLLVAYLCSRGISLKADAIQASRVAQTRVTADGEQIYRERLCVMFSGAGLQKSRSFEELNLKEACALEIEPPPASFPFLSAGMSAS